MVGMCLTWVAVASCLVAGVVGNLYEVVMELRVIMRLNGCIRFPFEGVLLGGQAVDYQKAAITGVQNDELLPRT